MAGDREKVLEAGMVDHIAKPLNVGEMFATIARWITPGPGGGERAAQSGAAAERNAGEVSLPPLPGIDVSAGMATCLHNEKLYTRILVKFREGQGRFAEIFEAARRDADPSSAVRAAHTLKGTAGNIGARGVQSAAAALERACSEDAPAERVEVLLHETLGALAPVIEGLAKVGASESPSAGGAAAAAPERVLELRGRLQALLEESDASAADVVEELVAETRGTPLEPALKRVSEALADYDFDAALEHLRAIEETENARG
jgi:HPt (histidine-containing phosphotransfer) domain-containing protein